MKVKKKREFWRGGVVAINPLEQTFQRNWEGGGGEPKNCCGGGIDIFWKHTI